MLEHRVASVTPGTAPPHLHEIVGDARVNFTFRSARNILGSEERFSSSAFWVDPGSEESVANGITAR